MAVSEGETEREVTPVTSRENRRLSLLTRVSFGAWNRLNFKSTRCLEHFEMNTDATMVKNVLKRVENDTKQTMTPIGKGIYILEQVVRTNWRKRYRWCETNVRKRSMEIEIVGFGLILFIWNYVWKGEKENFVWGIEEFWLRNEILFEELKRLHW